MIEYAEAWAWAISVVEDLVAAYLGPKNDGKRDTERIQAMAAVLEGLGLLRGNADEDVEIRAYALLDSFGGLASTLAETTSQLHGALSPAEITLQVLRGQRLSRLERLALEARIDAAKRQRGLA